MTRSSLRLWLLPLLCLGAGLLASVGALAIDRAFDYELVGQRVTGSPSAVQTLLSTIITSLVTLISVVLTVMTVAVQLAMGQFSPRIVGALLRDRANQLAIGLFGATCVFAIVTLREVDDTRDQVPGLTVLIAYTLELASLAVLILYVSRAGQRLRASGLIDLVGDQLHEEIERRFPEDGQAPPLPANIVAAPAAGVVEGIDERRLVELAKNADALLVLEVRMGDFVPAGAPLLRVENGDAAAVAGAVEHVALGDERTHDLDPAYGLRKLVDIATRSASEDPSTSVEAIHRIHDCMRQLAPRPFPSGRHTDARGALRLVEPVRDWDDFVLLAFEEVRLAATSSPQIARRLRAALLDLKSVAPLERQQVLDEQLDLLDAAVRRHFDDERDARAALGADAQGLG